MLCTCRKCTLPSYSTGVAQCSAVENVCVLCERPILVAKVGPSAFEGSWKTHGVPFRVQGRFVCVGDQWVPLEDDETILHEWRRQVCGSFVTRKIN
jgi:hypothetical protein